MNQRQLLILSYVLYLIPIPFLCLGGLFINIMATEYRDKHMKALKVFLITTVLTIIGAITIYIVIGIPILIITIVYFYIYMIGGLFKALSLKDEVNL